MPADEPSVAATLQSPSSFSASPAAPPRLPEHGGFGSDALGSCNAGSHGLGPFGLWRWPPYAYSNIGILDAVHRG